MTATTKKRDAARTWRDWHEVYESWPTESREVIDAAYLALCGVLREDFALLPNDDAAEQLIGEIVRFTQSETRAGYPSCQDCGEAGERRGHQTCQYPSDH